MRKTEKWIAVWLMVSLLAGLFCFASAENGASVEGKVWFDKNGDGIKGQDDIGYAYVKVVLQKKDGSQITDAAEAKTGKDGLFAFSGLEEGDYRLMIVSPDLGFTVPGEDSAALPAAGKVSYTVWEHITGNVTENIGLTKLSDYVGVLAFVDEDRNGGRRSSEQLLDGLAMTLIYERDGEEYELAEMKTTRSDKNYALVRNITPGTYRIRVTLPEGYVLTQLGSKISLYYNAFPAAEGDRVYSVPFDVINKESVGVAVGLIPSGSLKGVVNTVSGEGLEGVRFTLSGGEQETVLTAESNEAGEYRFPRVQEGNYALEVKLPAGTMFAADGSLITEENTQRASLPVEIVTGVSTGLEAIVTEASNAVRVKAAWYNGLTASEEGIQTGDDASAEGNVSVILLDENDNVIADGLTGESGILFDGLRAGEKKIVLKTDENIVICMIDGEETTVYESGAEYAVSPDQGIREYTAALVSAASVSGCVFDDKDHDGICSAEDTAVEGVRIQALDAAGVCRAETVTDGQGRYLLKGLLPSAYTVRVILETPYIASIEGEDNRITAQYPDWGETAPIRLEAGENSENVNIGLFCAGVIKGIIKTEDGIRSEDLGGVSGVTVELIGENGEPVNEYTYDISDENGEFTIDGVLPGVYRLRYTLPDSCIFMTPSLVGSIGISDGITVAEGDEIEMAPVAAVKTGSFEGTATHKGEPVKAHIEMRGAVLNNLYSFDSDAEGKFLQQNIRPDTYAVTVELEEGYVFGGDSDPLIGRVPDRTVSFELKMDIGQSVEGFRVDAALPSVIHGYIFHDAANNADAEDSMNGPYAGVQVSLIYDSRIVATTTSDSDGAFVFDQVIPGSLYRLRIALEEDMIITTAGEHPFSVDVDDGNDQIKVVTGILKYASVTGTMWNLDGTLKNADGLNVYLYNDYENGPVAQCVTDENGSFRFNGLLPGNYYLRADIPEGFRYARKIDEVVRPSYITEGNEPELFELAMGVEKVCDIGFGAPGKIGDYAWLDLNGNGLNDIGEPQLPGIHIALYQYGRLAAETDTDEYGWWEISGLNPGEYTMIVSMPDEVRTTVYRTDFPNVNSDLPEGMEGSAEGNVVVPSGDMNLSWDLGFVLKDPQTLPDAVKDLPAIDWSYGGKRNYPAY